MSCLLKCLCCCCLCLTTLQATWTPPEDIPLASPTAESPRLAFDADGNAVAVWRWYDGSYVRIQASTKLYGESWQETSDTISDAGYNALQPQIAVDPAGNAIAIWPQDDGANTRIQTSTKLFGEAWGDPVTISVAGIDAGFPKIAVDSYGNATAVWTLYGITTVRVQVSTKLFRGIWTDPYTLSDIDYEATSADVAVDSDGYATAVWSGSDGTNSLIQASTKLFEGTWTPRELLSEDGQNAHGPNVVVDADGNATVVWSRSDGTNSRIQASTKSLEGIWTPPDTLSEDGQDAYSPNVAVDSSGIATVVWSQSDGTNSRIRASTKPFEGIWTPPDTLSEDGQNAYGPYVAVDSSGNATVVWSRSDGTNGRIEASTKPFGGTWATPSALSGAGSNAGFEHIAYDSFGNATATWSDNVDFGGRIQFAIQYAPPIISSVIPNNGPVTGGSSVTIMGKNFFSTSSVTFGSASATSFTVVSVSEIVAVVPPGSSGIVDIRVQAAGGTSPITANDRFTYAQSTLLPPRHPRGKVTKRHHNSSHKYILRARWKKSLSTKVTAYRIYKKSKVVATIPFRKELTYKTHMQRRHSWKKFSVATVNKEGEESVHKKLKK